MEQRITVREYVDGSGKKFQVTDAFPDEVFITDEVLSKSDNVGRNERTGRIYVRTDNGEAEYTPLGEHDTYRKGYRAARVYQDVRWTPPPLPKPEVTAAPKPTPTPTYTANEYDDWSMMD